MGQPGAAVQSNASLQPGNYDYSGVKSVRVDGVDRTPAASLNYISQRMAGLLNQIQPDVHPIVGTVRIVVPDHDRMRVLALQQAPPQSTEGVLNLLAEQQRLAVGEFAAAVVRSQAFSNATIIQQNDTELPDAAGADYLMWYQVRSVRPNNAGPWIGRWLMRRTGTNAVVPLTVDIGSAPGVPRLLSFIKSVHFAASVPDPPRGFAGGAIPGGVAAPVNGAPRPVSSGSGMVVDALGHLLTNNHVVAGCPDLRITDSSGATDTAAIVATDPSTDLALLKTQRRWPYFARFYDGQRLRPGQSLVVTGFPLTGLVSPEMAVTTGSLTALAGEGGDARRLQFSAPIQPGNSGGPVLDQSGAVIGVATAELNGLMFAAAAGGAVPQNVNFAVGSDTARSFLAANQVSANRSLSHQTMGPADIGDLARRFTVRVVCWR